MGFFSAVIFGLWVAGTAQSQPLCGFGQHVTKLRTQILDGAPIQQDNRPSAIGSIEARNTAIRVHFQAEVPPAYAAQVLNLAETSYRHLVDNMGYVPPHADGTEGGDSRFDIYIVTDLQEGVGGYAGFSGFNETTPRADAISYLVIRHDLSERLLPFVVAHEMYHAVQVAYDWWEDLAFMEASATWVVDQIFDDNDLYWKYFPFFNREPWLALDFVSLKSPYQYGMGMFPLFLDEYLGNGDGTIIRKIWESTIQIPMDNEPDFFDVLDHLTANTGGRDKLMTEFTTWRALTGTRGDGQHFSEVGLWDDTVEPFFEVKLPQGTSHLVGEVANPIGPYGAAFFTVPKMKSGTSLDFIISPKGQGRFAVRILQKVSNGWEVAHDDLLVDEAPGQFALSKLEVAEETVVMISNLTDGTYDPDTSPWDGRPMGYEFSTSQ